MTAQLEAIGGEGVEPQPTTSPEYFRSSFWEHFKGIDVRHAGPYLIGESEILISRIDFPGGAGFQGTANNGRVRAFFTHMDEGDIGGHKAVFELLGSTEGENPQVIAVSLFQDDGNQTIQITKPEGMTDRQVFEHLGVKTNPQ